MAFGRTITTFDQTASNGVGSLVIIGASTADLETVDRVYLKNASNSASMYIKNDSETLETIYNAYASKASSPIRYAFGEGVLTIYTTHYNSNHRLGIVGKRKNISIRSLEDYLDLDTDDLELFINYLIRETSQIQGKQIPPSVERDITALERRT